MYHNRLLNNSKFINLVLIFNIRNFLCLKIIHLIKQSYIDMIHIYNDLVNPKYN